MKSTAEALGIKYYGCFAHCLNLIVDKTIRVCNVEAIDSSDLNANETQKSQLCELLDQCRALVGTFNHSTQMTDELIKLQEDENINGEKVSKVRLIQDVVTRSFMLERIVRLYDTITQVLEDRNFRKYKDHHLTLVQLEIIKKLVIVLKPVYIVTCKLSSEKHSTLSQILPSIYYIRKNVTFFKMLS